MSTGGTPDDRNPDVARDPRAVPKGELERIFHHQVAFDLTTPAVEDQADLPVEQLSPEVVLLLAEPGAGASMRGGEIRREYEDRGGMIVVSVEELRRYHPDYQAIDELALDQLEELTEPAARWFSDRAAGYLRERRFNVLIEDTQPDPDKMMATAEAYAASGFHVRVAALAVPAVISRITLIERFASIARYAGIGPWTTAEAHDAGYEATAEVVRLAETSPSVSRITIDTWHGPLHDAERSSDGTWETFSPDDDGVRTWIPTDQTAYDVLVDARNDPLSSLQRRAFANRLAATLDRLERLEPRYTRVLVEMATEIRFDLSRNVSSQLVRTLDNSLDILEEDLEDRRAARRALRAAEVEPDPPETGSFPPIEPHVDPGPDVGGL